MTTAGREVASIWIFEGGSAGEIRYVAPRGATAHGSGAVGGGADVDLDARMRKRRRGAAWIRSDSGDSTENHHCPPLSASDRSRTKRGQSAPGLLALIKSYAKSNERLGREMEIKRLGEELLAQAKQKDSLM
ncbi:hypothetical protein B296_00019960 [Ensete ventricosum]|uniref:Uncharacterized protein n=1 Tax=Ensete ventricosum TaxID=4639 RepID=A0A426YJ66_ENSVE|nr:hypothetical protein B296_00019960 [Ensete ventricosum]